MCAICTDKSGGQFGYAGLWCDCDKLIDTLYYRDYEFMIELFRKDGLIEKRHLLIPRENVIKYRYGL